VRDNEVDNRWRIVIAVVILGVMALGGALPGQAAGKLRVGQTYVWLGDLPLYIAQEKGFYKKHDVDVDFITFRGGGELASALVGGSVDVAVAALDHAIKMREKGLDVVGVLVIQDKLGFTMFARKGAGIKTVADLKGKVLGTSAPGSASDNYMRYLVAKAGLDPVKDVTLVASGNEGRIAALKQGAVQGAAFSEPGTSVVLSEGFGEVLHDGTQWEYPFTVAMVKRDVLAKNREAVKAFIEATLEGARLIRANPAEAEAVAVKLFGKADPNVIRQATRNYFPTFSQTGAFSEKSVKFAMELLVDTKTIKEPVPIAPLLDQSLLPKR
jgi:NitT/TauT family transport system substrate-binding protein